MKIKCETIHGTQIEVDKTDLTLRLKTCAIVYRNNKILVNPSSDGYSFPGGGVEIGESPEDALVRETLDETGYQLDSFKIFHVSNTYFVLPDSLKPVQTVTLFYHGELKNDVKHPINLDMHEKTYMKDSVWIGIDQLLNAKLYNPIPAKELLLLAGLI